MAERENVGVVQTKVVVHAQRPAAGVRTWTKSRHGLTMVSEYLSYRRPSLMGMKMVEGPPLFRTFSGSWGFADLDGDA